MRTSRPTRNAHPVDTSGKPTVISTFCGTGGSSLGYHWAGFKELLAIDFEAHAVECFKLNFPDVPIWHKSVTDVTGKQIMDFCKIKWGELDVFDGSPPCQGFSTAGKRQVTDPRNDLFMQYCRLIDELGPKVFVMENVSGMAKGVMKGKFIQIIQQLKSMNYEVKCKQMNAMYYGVPQFRQRIIFIGVRKDLSKQPSFPIPSKKLIHIKSVVADCRIGHSRGQFDNRLRPTNRPAHTLTKTVSMQFKNKDGSIDRPTVEELLAICSFPKDWKLRGSYSQKYARLGNAVMPKFMQAIATTIKDQILT
jgi:DNA (cytosine-5)-methyltransferase 1